MTRGYRGNKFTIFYEWISSQRYHHSCRNGKDSGELAWNSPISMYRWKVPWCKYTTRRSLWVYRSAGTGKSCRLISFTISSIWSRYSSWDDKDDDVNGVRKWMRKFLLWCHVTTRRSSWLYHVCREIRMSSFSFSRYILLSKSQCNTRRDISGGIL